MDEAAVEVQEKPPIYVLLKMANQPSYLIGRVMTEDNSSVTMHYPVAINVYTSDEGMEVITSKYLPFAQGDVVDIVKTSIHSIATPKQTLIQYYLTFMKKWQEQGMEQILEERILGVKPAAPQDQSLNTDPPSEEDAVH